MYVMRQSARASEVGLRPITYYVRLFKQTLAAHAATPDGLQLPYRLRDGDATRSFLFDTAPYIIYGRDRPRSQ